MLIAAGGPEQAALLGDVRQQVDNIARLQPGVLPAVPQAALHAGRGVRAQQPNQRGLWVLGVNFQDCVLPGGALLEQPLYWSAAGQQLAVQSMHRRWRQQHCSLSSTAASRCFDFQALPAAAHSRLSRWIEVWLG